MTTLLLILSTAIGLAQIDTRVGTDAADSPTAGVFGSAGEVYGTFYVLPGGKAVPLERTQAPKTVPVPRATDAGRHPRF